MAKLERVVISGGGTGGHINPALAIADEIKSRYPNCRINFVGAKGRMEMTKVPSAGYEIEGLWISGIERKITSLKNLSFPFKLLSSLFKAGRLLRKHKPQIAIGVGGFASGPLLFRASKKGIPTLIQEQNSFPGITNRNFFLEEIKRKQLSISNSKTIKKLCSSWEVALVLHL